MNITKEPPPLPYETPRPARRVNWSELPGRLGPLLGLLLVFGFFSLLSPRTFPAAGNLDLILRQTAVVGVAALGMTLIIVSGGIDLSVGSNVALSAVVIALMLVAGVPAPVAAAGGVLVSATAGAAIGLCVTALRIPPFIVTLGMWGALRGVAKGLSDSRSVYAPRGWTDSFLKGLIWAPKWYPTLVVVLLAVWVALLVAHFVAAELRWRRWMTARTMALALFPFLLVVAARAVGGGWPVFRPGVWLMLLLAVAVAFLLRYTRFGRHVFAIGSNESAARLCGVSVGPAKVLIYSVGGALAGLAGVLHFSYVNGAVDPAGGMGLELGVIAAVVIGGASLSGGQGSVFGALVGALIMQMLANGFTSLGWEDWVQEIATGGIIIFAGALDRLRHRG